MKNAMRNLRRLGAAGPVVLAVFSCWSFPAPARAAENVFPNGSFEKVDHKGQPEGWKIAGSKKLQLAGEGENHWLQISNADPNSSALTTVNLKLEASWKVLVVSVRMRGANLQPGKESWHTARLAMKFKGADGNQVGAYPPVPSLSADTGWINREVIMNVPEGADRLEVQPAMFYCTGVFDVDDITVLPYASAGEYFREKARPLLPKFPEGQFTELDKEGLPVGWSFPSPKMFKVMDSGDRKLLRITNENPKSEAAATGFFLVDPNWAEVQMSVKMQTWNFKPGEQGTKAGAVRSVFLDAAGNECGKGPGASLNKDSQWQDMSASADVPDGAVYLKISLGLHQASGSLDIRDLFLSAVPKPPTKPK